MITLAIDTCLDVCSVALIDGESAKVLGARHVPMQRGHAEALFPLIDYVFAEAGLKPNELQQVAVTIGPGTFTGVRIGLSAARGLAVGAQLSVIGVSSLEAIQLCALAADAPEDPIAALIDARRGEVYGAVYDGSGKLLMEPRIFPASELSNLLPAAPLVIAGSGAAIATAQDPRFTVSATPDLPDASVWGPQVACRNGEALLPLPLYLRAPDAKPPAKGSQVQRLPA